MVVCSMCGVVAACTEKVQPLSLPLLLSSDPLLDNDAIGSPTACLLIFVVVSHHRAAAV